MSMDNQQPEFTDVNTTAQFDRLVIEPVEVPAPLGLSASDHAAVQALPATSALLIVHHGPNSGARFLLDADRTTAGRDTKADIFLDDVTVSRKHAEFLFADGTFAVRDVGSLNGTYVNRERIEQVLLNAGDEVQIGKYRLMFYPSPNRVQSAASAAEIAPSVATPQEEM